MSEPVVSAKPSRWRFRVVLLFVVVLLLAGTAGYGVVSSPRPVDGSATRATARVVDTDRDGIPDEVETKGWATPDGIRRTDPAKADTDGDGLTDAEEADLSLDPTARDTDGDHLSDTREVDVVGTDPTARDTDGDGFDDAFEEANRAERGLDPQVADVKVSKTVYVTDFAKGFLLGDINREDTLAWLAGSLASGGASALPVVGWVVGSAADLRDVIANAIRADWVSSGFSAAGLVPDAGDAMAIPGKAAKFVARNPALATAVASTVVAMTKVPTAMKVASLRKIFPGVDALRKSGAGEKSLLRMASSRLDLDALAAARKRPGHVEMPAAPFLADGPAGEKHLAKNLGASASEMSTQKVLSTAECMDVCNRVSRRIDVYADGTAYESKVGYNTLTASARRQIQSDCHLIDRNVIEAAHWVFYASAHTGKLGASGPLLDALDACGITYSIVLPR